MKRPHLIRPDYEDRITDEHWLVYAVEAAQIVIVAARHHY
ncbi:MAG: YoeB-like toxin of bacterial type toxin-antitoxin system [Microbacteriaceae bacterium]|jgi:Txe/YoeB family toxin of Txe-Axe toxin-antitoxin module|nr:YoeB-like toxin of bacterial type toxin-antitoxin system [Microbacteriaceae bacterium]